jgi:hypothetical protein
MVHKSTLGILRPSVNFDDIITWVCSICQFQAIVSQTQMVISLSRSLLKVLYLDPFFNTVNYLSLRVQSDPFDRIHLTFCFLSFRCALEIDYSSSRRVPPVKLTTQIQANTTTSMPASTSLQDINSHTHKFNWSKEQPLVNLSE